MAPTSPPHHCHGDTPLLTHFKETPTWSNCRKKFLPIIKSAYSSFKIVSYVDKPMQFSSVKTCKHKPGGASTQPPPNCVCCCTMTQLLSFWASELSHKADLKPSRVSRGGQSQGYSWDLQRDVKWVPMLDLHAFHTVWRSHKYWVSLGRGVYSVGK